MNEVTFTGGIEAGSASASSPLAKMIVTPYSMQINASIIGTFIFRANDIVSVEEYSGLLGIRSGVKINHRVSSYTSKIIFYPSGRTTDVLNVLQQSSFAKQIQPIPYDIEDDITLMQSSGSFAIKKNFAIAIIVIWNLLCLPAFITFYYNSKPGTKFIALAPGALAIYCLLVLFIPALQQQLLKPGHKFQNIRSGVIFILIITSFIAIIGSIVSLATNH